MRHVDAEWGGNDDVQKNMNSPQGELGIAHHIKPLAALVELEQVLVGGEVLTSLGTLRALLLALLPKQAPLLDAFVTTGERCMPEDQKETSVKVRWGERHRWVKCGDTLSE